MMKYDWNSFFSKLEQNYDLSLLLSELEDLSVPLGSEEIKKEINSKVHFTEEPTKSIVSIFLYLKIFFNHDFAEYTKEIHFKVLEQKLKEKYQNKTKDVISNTNLTNQQKDQFLESFDRELNTELRILTNNYQNIYQNWISEHQKDVDEYNLVKNKLESWIKSKTNS